MSPKDEKVYFEEDRGYYLRKKLRYLGIGFPLALIMPVFLPYMLLYVLKMSELFESEAMGILAFFGITFAAGLYFIVKGLTLPRMRVYWDRMSNPAILGEKFIPLGDIKRIGRKFNPDDERDGESTELWLYLKPDSKGSRNRDYSLGRFLNDDADALTEVLSRKGVKSGLEYKAKEY